MQSYLREFGTRKCEANALITRPEAARELVDDALMEWLSQDGIDQWEAENDAAEKDASHHADGIRRVLAMFDAAGVLYNPRQLGAAASKGIASLPPAD